MPCLNIPGTNLARCGTLRPAPSSSGMRTPSPNTMSAHSEGHSSGRADGAPTSSYGDTAAPSKTMLNGQADRPALPASMMTGGSTSDGNALSASSQSSTRCASPIRNQNQQQRAAAVTDILAMSPSRITRPQIELVEASLPLLDNLVPPLSSASAAAPSVGSTDICPPMIHSWMSKCADGALGRDPSAERMCLQVRKTFGACSHGLSGGL